MKTLLEVFKNELDNVPNILNQAHKNMTITAVNKKHQKQVNKAVKCLIAYNNLNDLRNLAYDDCNEKLVEKLDNKCAIAWDKYYDAKFDLPKREVDQIEKSDLY
jgi:ribosome assembly protein YihI (activator of Der GTPase)